MTANALTFTPGNLVRARGREWIVLPGGSEDVLRLRPLSGSEAEIAWVHTALEPGISPAHFPPPAANPETSQDGALLLRNALLLSLRRGAGPFRSFGNVAVEPRAYQLVPLLMALRMDPVRLLIADDVGIGKTIEAGLIVRELVDRGEIARFTVLCPPHLVDQWLRELDLRFNLKATAVTAASAARLERELPVNESIFSVHPYTVVSLDYIKSDRRRHDFVRTCPEFVVVDEAHTCTSRGQGRQQRYELLKALAADELRNLLLLTATPHSGDEEAFYHLLGLLKPEFATLGEREEKDRRKLRERLADHLVQRRRPDIAEWQDAGFPQREKMELTYKLTGDWERFFEDILAYCRDVTTAAGDDSRRQRLTFWGTLALMRCVSSSPAAAAQALRTRMARAEDAEAEELLGDSVFDGAQDALPQDDTETGVDNGDPRLAALVAQAERLSGQQDDPKLKALVTHVQRLLKDGYTPVVFCRYIATAHYVASHIKQQFPKAIVQSVTGELTAEERVAHIEEIDADDDRPRVLVATDCLSEGVNLQHYFDAVVHYDLSWNPTRHEQREGRVDRFGQTSPTVRATLIYGANNPVDGAVLQVILRKADAIRKELGVPVPLPDDGHQLAQALMKAVMLRDHPERSLTLDLDYGESDAAMQIDRQWRRLADEAKKSRTVFSQNSLKPAEVVPEWERMRDALGSQEDVAVFLRRALARVGAAPEEMARGVRIPVPALPPAVRERLQAEGVPGRFRAYFDNNAPVPAATFLHRSHPLVSVLAEDLLERALVDTDTIADGMSTVGRVGVWRSSQVQLATTVLLLRLRHQLTETRAGQQQVMLVDEALAVAVEGRANIGFRLGADVLALLGATPSGDVPDHVRAREIDRVLCELPALAPRLEAFADERAGLLLADHQRVRAAAKAGARQLSAKVTALKPVDVIGAFVLLPVN